MLDLGDILLLLSDETNVIFKFEILHRDSLYMYS